MKNIHYKELALGLLFLILPTILIMYPLLGFLAEYYSLLFINKHILVAFLHQESSQRIYYTKQKLDSYLFLACYY